MTSIALTSIAERAANYPPIQRRNQLSKISWFASDSEGYTLIKNGRYFIC